QSPLLRIQLHQLAASRYPRQLLQQQPALASAAQPQLADKLLIARAMPRRALDPANQFAVSPWIRCLCHQSEAYRLAARHHFSGALEGSDSGAFSSSTASASVVE